MSAIEQLPHVNAALNALATVLLISGWLAIRRRREVVHRRFMIACFLTSIAFLTTYGIYHWHVPSKHFPSSPPVWVRRGYLGLLASHVVLAASVPFLAGWTLYLGLVDDRCRHRAWAKWTFPIWLYVSITGVLVYVLLYWVYAESP